MTTEGQIPEMKGMYGKQLFQAAGSAMRAPLFDYDRVLKLLDGAIDLHIHSGPDAYATRSGDELEFAIQACRAGMKAVVFKCHSAPSTRSVQIVQKVVNQWAEENHRKRIDIFGGVVLNYSVGGLNPEAVVCNFRLRGKYVWTPNLDASHHRKVTGQSGGIDVIDERRNVVPELKEIFSLIAEGDMVLGLCHQNTEERLLMIDEAKRAGIKRIELVHPLLAINKMTIGEIKTAVDKGGVYAGLYCWTLRPPMFEGWDEVKELLRVVGPEHIVVGTDVGMFTEVIPVEAIRSFIAEMLVRDVPDKDMGRMLKTNPTELLY